MRTKIKYADPETTNGFRFAFVNYKLQDAKVLAESERFLDVTLGNGKAVVVATSRIIDMREVN